VLSLLRPGKRPSGEEAARILRHVIHRIRHNWPRVQITVRGDGHYTRASCSTVGSAQQYHGSLIAGTGRLSARACSSAGAVRSQAA